MFLVLNSMCTAGNSPLSGSAAVALRGTFALLLRSVSSTQRELNFCGLAVEEHHR